MGKKRARPLQDGWSWHENVAVSEPKVNLQFASSFHSPTVCVLVGSEKKPYYPHSQLLSDKCPYFKGREDFRAKSAPNNPISISFDGTSCEVFDMFTEYIYTSEYTAPLGQDTNEIHELHTRLYCFADFLMMDELKKMVLNKMRTLLKESSWCTPIALTSQAIINLLDIVYDNTIDDVQLDASSREDADHDIEGDESNNKEIGSASPPMIESYHKPKPDPMRVLIVHYAASQIETLRNDKKFDRLMADKRGIARDLISFVRPATPCKEWNGRFMLTLEWEKDSLRRQ